MTSITDTLFKPTAILCQCGRGHLNRIGKMLICEHCGWYKVHTGGGQILKLKNEN